MKAKQYREMSDDELEGKLEELQKHLFDLRVQAVTEKLQNSKEMINTKRDIARIKTIIREKSDTLDNRQRKVEDAGTKIKNLNRRGNKQ